MVEVVLFFVFPVLEEMVIVDAEDAILVCTKEREQEVRAIVRELEAQGETDYL